MRKRSASFTESASGNASATSGSSLTTSPNLLRPGPSFRTRSALRSYSGRSSSSISVSIFFICFPLRWRYLPRANQPGNAAPIRIRHEQQAALPRLPDDNIAVLIVGMIRVVEIDIERIVEDGLGLLERDAVLLKIGLRLSFIP